MYCITDNEMILIPMQNTGHGNVLYQIFKGGFYPIGPEADTFCSIADSQQRNSLPGNETPFTQILQAIALAIKFCNHTEGCGTTIHGIQLGIMRERFHIIYWARD